MTTDSTRKSYSRKGRKVKKCHEKGRWLSPAARHTGSSSLKTSPHTTSEAMAPGSLWWFQVTVAEDSLSSGSLASQTRTPTAVTPLRSSERPHSLPGMAPGVRWLVHGGRWGISRPSARRACQWEAVWPGWTGVMLAAHCCGATDSGARNSGGAAAARKREQRAPTSPRLWRTSLLTEVAEAFFQRDSPCELWLSPGRSSRSLASAKFDFVTSDVWSVCAERRLQDGAVIELRVIQ